MDNIHPLLLRHWRLSNVLTNQSRRHCRRSQLTLSRRHHYTHPRRPSSSEVNAQGSEPWVPHITIIRPVKGVEPYLHECLASTFYQTYPEQRLTIYFCLASRDDPAHPILERLIADFPDFDARLFVEEEDPNLSGDGGKASNLGPNPKIRNMSRAYREAKGDIMWIVDCNVWVGPSVANRMVNLLCGFIMDSKALRKKYKFVHQLPLSVDVSPPLPGASVSQRIENCGGLLEETFLSTSHAKFYTAINTVAIAPCIVGKSNMFRRSHLNALTSAPSNVNPDPNPPPGIDHFSYNICEDHLIGDLLWKSPIPPLVLELAKREGRDPQSPQGRQNYGWGNHTMLPSTSPENLAIQPTISYSLGTYIDRRTRWLRVRKFTVIIATLIEPGTESLLACAYAAFALTTLPWFHATLGIPQTWTAFAALYLLSVISWACVDYWVWGMLHANTNGNGPPFAKPREQTRTVGRWALAWLGREVLAFPIWAWAFFGGVSVVWRGRKFWVGVDMRVHEIGGHEGHVEGETLGRTQIGLRVGRDSGSGGESGRKNRRD